MSRLEGDSRFDASAAALLGSAQWPKVFWINLDRCVERRDAMLAKFSRYGVERKERVTAIDGRVEAAVRAATDDEIAASADTKPFRELACTLSHLSAIKCAYDQGLDEALIMEDDVNFRFCPYWRCPLPKLLAQRPHNTNIVQLAWITDHNNWRNNTYGAARAGAHFVARQGGVYCAMAYFITRDAMRALIERHFVPETGKWRVVGVAGPAIADSLLYRLPHVYTSTLSLFCSDGLDTTVHGSNNEVAFHRREDERHLQFLQSLYGPTSSGDDGVSDTSS